MHAYYAFLAPLPLNLPTPNRPDGGDWLMCLGVMDIGCQQDPGSWGGKGGAWRRRRGEREEEENRALYSMQ